MNSTWKLICGISLFFCYMYLTCATNIEWKANTKKYGEPCVDQDECVDFRMICSKIENICQCDQFHDWTELDKYRTECVPNFERLRTFLANLEETTNFEEKLSKEAHNLFIYLGLAGVIAISFGFLIALGCVIYIFYVR